MRMQRSVMPTYIKGSQGNRVKVSWSKGSSFYIDLYGKLGQKNGKSVITLFIRIEQVHFLISFIGLRKVHFGPNSNVRCMQYTWRHKDSNWICRCRLMNTEIEIDKKWPSPIGSKLVRKDVWRPNLHWVHFFPENSDYPLISYQGSNIIKCKLSTHRTQKTRLSEFLSRWPKWLNKRCFRTILTKGALGPYWHWMQLPWKFGLSVSNLLGFKH